MGRPLKWQTLLSRCTTLTTLMKSVMELHFQECLALQYVWILSSSFTITLLRTTDSLMPFQRDQVIKPLPSLGELVVPLPVFHVLEVTVAVKVPLVTCAVMVVCSPQPRSGEDGTDTSISSRREAHSAPLLLPPLSHLLSWLVAIALIQSQRYPLFSTTLRRLRGQRISLTFLSALVPMSTLSALSTPRLFVLVVVNSETVATQCAADH